MMLRIAGASLAMGMAVIACSPAAVQDSAENTSEPAIPSGSLVPADFEVPVLVEGQAEGGRFQLVPLGPELVKVDFDAYMSSIEHLQQTFTRSTGWPHEGITDEDAMLDMETEQGRFQRRESFAYGVLTPDGSRERGSVYVRPSPVEGYDAVVMLWVTKADYDAGFDAELYGWVTNWIATDWPFQSVAYPGRAIAWEDWDAEVAAAEAADAAAEDQGE